ncbi:MAG: hypothetical protein GY747_11860 [Planctomycetes bacterium]|nr:hypothetical protein [Planctomycetota bacterium]MCP4771688.1 hypothetical protein [Planctomycetota bacterium]MCP4860012.1 hypothetical protein [Planctomycetota bacterium]
MPRKKLRRVVKRDGSEQSFDVLRLTETITSCLQGVGEKAVLAQQFTDTVVVRASNAIGLVATTKLAKIIIDVFESYDCAAAAEAFAWYRLEEEDLVGNIRIHTQTGCETQSRPWERDRLAHSLMRDRYFESAVARTVARNTERRLIATGLRHMTGRLVAALAENECRTMGLRGEPLHSEHLGIDRRQLRAWLGGECLPAGSGDSALPTLGADGQDARPVLGAELLARFALEEVLTAPQLEAWRAGRFDLLALGDWMRPLRLWLHPHQGESEHDFWRRVADARMECHEVQVFRPASAHNTELSRSAPQWLQAPGVNLRLSTSDPALALDWAEQELWHSMPAKAFLQADSDVAAKLVGLGHTTVQWQPPRRFPAASDLTENSVERGAVINLVHLAAAAGALAVEEFFALVQESLDLACGALATLIRRAKMAARPRITLLPAGLDAALELLLPDSALRMARSRQLILALRDRFERAAKAHELRLEHSNPAHPQAVGTRLAERDGVLGPIAYRCGWLPGQLDVEMVSLALDTAPWLEIPAAKLYGSSWSGKLLPRTPVDQKSNQSET